MGVGDSLHMLVAADADRTIGIAVIVGRGFDHTVMHSASVGHVGVEYGLVRSVVVGVIGTELGECTRTDIVTGPFTRRSVDKEEMVEPAAPMVHLHGLRHFVLNLCIRQASVRSQGIEALWEGIR